MKIYKLNADPDNYKGCFIKHTKLSDNDLEKIVKHTINEQKAQYDSKFDNLGEGNTTTGLSVDEVKNAPEEYEDPLYNTIVEYAIQVGEISSSKFSFLPNPTTSGL